MYILINVLLKLLTWRLSKVITSDLYLVGWSWWSLCMHRHMYMRPHVFVPYQLRKFRLTSSFSYWYLWHLSILAFYHLLSSYYVRVRLVHLFFLCLHAVSCPFPYSLHAGFDSSSFFILVVFDFFFVIDIHNHISNKGVLRILLYVLSTSHVENIVEAKIFRILSHTAVLYTS